MVIPYYVSPEQMVQDKAEYARKGIAKGKSIVSLQFDQGVLLVAENPSSSLNKISEIYDNIAFAGAGKYSEYENLRKAGIRHADLKGYAYGREDVNARSLANAYSQLIGDIFSHEIKPLEVEILVSEIRTDGQVGLYRISFDGSIGDEERFAAIGGQVEEINNLLAKQYRPDLDLKGALALAVAALATAGKQAIPAKQLEVALLDSNYTGRRFRRLSQQEVSELVQER
ncbi:MAG: proteasome subunit alpha [Thermodesulfobacteriota bacterium]